MIIEIPDELLPYLSRSEEELKIDFAIFLYKSEILSLGKAAELLNLSKMEFQQALKERNIPINYTVQDVDQDVETLKKLGF